MRPQIIYEDNNIIICNKPAGVLSQSDKGFSQDLLGSVRTYLVEKGRADDVHIINRLDRPVGGLVLFALNKKTAASLTAMSGEHSIEKNYYAVVAGRMDEKGTLCDYLLKDAKTNTSRIVKEGTKDAKKASLTYTLIKTLEIDGREASLVDIRLHTGRHHQIRVQMSGCGHPLLGDTKYNASYQDVRGTAPMLFAYKLAFNNPVGADRITVEIKPEGGLWQNIDWEK